MIKLSFLGLGVMGFPMAGHLANAGYDVTVYNRTSSKADAWCDAYSGKSSVAAALTPAAAAQDADIVLACVGNDQDSLAVGQDAISAMKSGALYIDHTTVSALCAEQLAALASNQACGFVDAPVSGGEAGAVNGQLSIMCGGTEADIAAAQPILDIYAKRVVHVGGVGQGQLCKAVNQIAIAGLVQGLSEAIHFAQKAGLDIDKTLEAVSGGAAQSWQMENRGKTMAADEFDFGFAVEWMRKDLKIALSEAERHGARLPVTALVDQFYAQVEAIGGKRFDTSSLIKLLNK